jgi:hypothetical protein
MNPARAISVFAVCGLLLAASAAEAAPMRFRVTEIGCPDNCAKVLLGDGEIAFTTDRAFRLARRRAGNLPVILNSPGGDLPGGLNLGLAFREAKSSVGVAPGGACISACAYALFGGVERKVLRGGRVGIHQFIEVSRDRASSVYIHPENSRIIVGYLVWYARKMGVSTEVIRLALATPYNKMRFLSRRQMERMRVTTGGGRSF